MKAHRIRRALWIASLALGAGVVAVGVLAVLYKAPAAQASTAWADKAVEEYKARQPEKIVQVAVESQDIQKVFLNEEWKERWFPFTGPRIPPKAEPIKVDVEAPKGPTGLEAIGRVRMLLYRPAASGGSIVFWEFQDKKSDEFMAGQFIAQKGQAGRFKLVDVVRIDAGRSRWKILYEVYDDPKGEAKSKGELIYDAEPKLNPDGPIRVPKKPAPVPAPGAAGGAAAGAAPGTATPGVATPAAGPSVVVVGGDKPATGSQDWKLTVREVARGRKEVVIEDDAWAALKDKSVEKLIEDVRTEPYNSGGVRGLRISPTGGGAGLADKLDIRRGDILISINGQPIASRDDALRVARAIPPETARVAVVIDRDGERITYDVDPRDPKTRRAAAAAAPR